jgi:acyl dehydratase
MVTVDTRAFKQDGTLVMSYQRTVLVPKRGYGVEDKMQEAQKP